MRTRADLQPRQAGARRDGRPGGLYRSDRRADATAKLAQHCTSAAMGVAAAEVFTMGIKAGVDPLDLWEAVRREATAASAISTGSAGLYRASTTRPISPCAAAQDVGLAVGLGREVGAPMRLANMAFEELTEARTRLGHAQLHRRPATAGRALRHRAAHP